ncbi:hypothetical protein [Methylobacterium oryzihabitans]|uniref:Uncharacterized protein n=1 Tax=Methylobacterium oryzihabitans TaxID=2499852 RepID=A0A3S2V653_9HYPH|nr:hypothetical protein [Methylobacterium oryzihabitans]RVU15335.1 hypothetical protein EOE48_20090 [Methylobacterium oryzihabitans]
MALLDTLRSVRDRTRAEREAESDRPQIIARWQSDVAALYDEIHGWLLDYERDGYLTVSTQEIHLREEPLGLYTLDAMLIHVDDLAVRLQPAGRYVLGATGRIDMFRQGRSARDERVLLVRQATPEGERWMLRPPAGPRTGAASGLEPLDRASFEAAFESLLS